MDGYGWICVDGYVWMDGYIGMDKIHVNTHSRVTTSASLFIHCYLAASWQLLVSYLTAVSVSCWYTLLFIYIA